MTCKAKQENNGVCPHHNLQCGWPKCKEPEQEPDLGGVDVFYPKDEHYKTVISDVQRLFNDNRQSASDAVQKEIDAYKAANPHCDVVAIVGDLAPYRRRTIGLPDSAPLYTTPPQRTWVGLEAEDRLCAKYMQDAPEGIEAVIDYVEAKLKEKNT